MRWVRGIDENQIRTDDGRFVIYKSDPDCFHAWGPVGSQDVDYIRCATARVLRDEMGMSCNPEDLDVVAGRGLLGVFTSPDEARQACVEYDAAPEPARARASDPESSHEAARAIEASGELERQREAALRAVETNNGLTSKHLAELTGLDRHMLARRLPELARAGLVKRGPMVRDAGRPAGVTWWRVGQGASL